MARVLFLCDQYVIEPLGIGYLSSSLREAGHSTFLLQVPKKRWGNYDPAPVWRQALDLSPDLLCYSVTTGQHRLWREFHGRISRLLAEERSAPLAVFGGPHCTFFPQFIDQTGVEIVCRGEGERVLCVLADAVDDGWQGQDPLTIRGLWFRSGDASRHNEMAALPDVDQLPWPDRDLLYGAPRNANNQIRDVLASRGCPYNCCYCYNSAYRAAYKGKGETRRTRAPGNVVEECKDLTHRFPTRLIYFQDDLLTRPQDWFRELTLRYSREIGVPYHCHVRPDCLDREDVQCLKRTGCQGVTMAIENGDGALRAKALGRKMGDDEIVQACAWVREAGLRLRTENMIGIPGETIGTVWKTVRLNARCKPDVPWASLYQPYPGTALGELAEREGYCLVDPETVRPSFFEDLPLELPNRERLVNLQRFFGAMVRHSTLRPLANILALLPPNRRFLAFSEWYRRRGYVRRLYRP